MDSRNNHTAAGDLLHFIDTSVLRHLLCATTKAREYYKSALGPKKYVCGYIHMEFVRAFVITLVEYYFVLAMPHIKHVEDANIFWSNKFQSRKLSGVLMLVQPLFGSRPIDFSSTEDKPRALRFLADYIRRLVAKVHTLYADTGADSTRCARPTKLTHYDPTDTDGSLSEFWNAFKDSSSARANCSIDHCLLQTHKSEVQLLLRDDPPRMDSDRKGYDKLINSLAELVKTPGKLSCASCARIGDAVISLLCPPNMRLEHTDFSFDYSMALLKKKHFRHPSEISLNK